LFWVVVIPIDRKPKSYKREEKRREEAYEEEVVHERYSHISSISPC